MPKAGLSLVGFMDEDMAIRHLRNDCVFDDPSNPSLRHHWKSARDRIGTGKLTLAGRPEILEIPSEHAAYIEQLRSTEWIASLLAKMPDATFKLVEIDPLLAFQVAIDNERSNHHCGAMPHGAKIADVLPACLPIDVPQERIEAIPSSTKNALLVRTKCLGFQIKQAGQLGEGLNFGIEINLTPPLLHVVEYNNRYYLHNGFHRALGIRAKGLTHLPCLVRRVSDSTSVGISDGGTLPLKTLESDNPPTLAHFTQGRAYDVRLKSYSRVFTVTWNEHLVSND